MALCLPCPAFCAAEPPAEADGPAWGAEVYGGQYYDESRIGAYLVSSARIGEGPTVIGELLHERYTDYGFSGVGGHILWPMGAFGEAGLIASQAWESYEAAPGSKEHYQTRLLGAEWELERGRFALAVQAGRYLKDYAGAEPSYLSADAFFWGTDYDWYLRAATRRVSNAWLNLVEGYRVFHSEGRALTVYAGISDDELNAVSPGGTDSVYVGAYTSLFSTPQTNLTFWIEAAKEEDEALLTLELNLAFGPGARAPYITAFGYSLDN